MIERYFRFKEDGVFEQLGEDVPEMLELYLTQAEDRQLLGIRKFLIDLQVVTKQLQRSDMTFAEMRVIFDMLIEEYPQMGEYIAQDARIVHSQVFESALIKISSRMEHTLTDEEKQSVIKLKRLNSIPRLAAPDVMDLDANDVLDNAAPNGNAVGRVQPTIMQRAQARLNAYVSFYIYQFVLNHLVCRFIPALISSRLDLSVPSHSFPWSILCLILDEPVHYLCTLKNKCFLK
jgi:hypothetical protein